MPKAHGDHEPASHLGADPEAAAKGLCTLQTEEPASAKGEPRRPGAPPRRRCGCSILTPGFPGRLCRQATPPRCCGDSRWSPAPPPRLRTIVSDSTTTSTGLLCRERVQAPHADSLLTANGPAGRNYGHAPHLRQTTATEAERVLPGAGSKAGLGLDRRSPPGERPSPRPRTQRDACPRRDPGWRGGAAARCPRHEPLPAATGRCPGRAGGPGAAPVSCSCSLLLGCTLTPFRTGSIRLRAGSPVTLPCLPKRRSLPETRCGWRCS